MENVIFHVDVNSAFLSWEAVYRLYHLGEKVDLREQVAAVGCWFTSKGESMPLMMKVETEQREIVAVKDIQLLTSEKQWYAGIMTVKYRCRAVLNGMQKEFILLFRPDECTWKIVL